MKFLGYEEARFICPDPSSMVDLGTRLSTNGIHSLASLLQVQSSTRAFNICQRCSTWPFTNFHSQTACNKPGNENRPIAIFSGAKHILANRPGISETVPETDLLSCCPGNNRNCPGNYTRGLGVYYVQASLSDKLLPADECQYQWIRTVRTGVQLKAMQVASRLEAL